LWLAQRTPKGKRKMKSRQYRNWTIHNNKIENTYCSGKWWGEGIANTDTEGQQFGAQSGPRAADSEEELRRRIDADADTNK
jgi:hypothetical protein